LAEVKRTLSRRLEKELAYTAKDQGRTDAWSTDLNECLANISLT